MADHTITESQAIDLFQRGKFVAARDIFTQLTNGSESELLRAIYKFNAATCLASQGNCLDAINEMLDITQPNNNDFESLHNKALCLIRLNKPDMALYLIGIIARLEGHEQVKTNDHDDQYIVDLLLDFMESLPLDYSLNKKQCDTLERLMIKYKAPLIARCCESAWTQNMGHILFLSDTKFTECLEAYETLLDENDGEDNVDDDSRNLLKSDATVLGNICVSYILTGHNRDAEELIKETECAEESAARESPEFAARNSNFSSSIIDNSNNQKLRMGHLVRLNLAIGTLYCLKGNHEFGLTRIMKSLQPLEKNLTTSAWQQAKRCILFLLDRHCKQIIYIRDDLFEQVVAFLMQCECFGIHLVANERLPLEDGRNSITYEARYLRSIILPLIDD